LIDGFDLRADGDVLHRLGPWYDAGEAPSCRSSRKQPCMMRCPPIASASLTALISVRRGIVAGNCAQAVGWPSIVALLLPFSACWARYTYQWSSMLILAYFMEGRCAHGANVAPARFGAAEILVSMVFTAAICYVRFTHALLR
jgi:uncharacterized membrane protein